MANLLLFMPLFIVPIAMYFYHLQLQIFILNNKISLYEDISFRNPKKFPFLSSKTPYATLPESKDNKIEELLQNWTKFLDRNTPKIWQTVSSQEESFNNDLTINCHYNAIIPNSDIVSLPKKVVAKRASDILRECGFVYLDNLYSASFVDRIRSAYENFLVGNGSSSSPSTTATAVDPKMFQYPCQGVGRIEHMMPFQSPWNTSNLSPYASPILISILDLFLKKPFKLELMTIINSKSNSKNQRWHQGWRYLFQQTERVPPTSLVATLPLDDVTMEMGGTQFCPRKKLRFYHGFRCDNPVQAATTKGTVVLFDYKTLHRGPGNKSEKDRPMVSMVFSKSWFVNVEAFVNRGITMVQTLHQRRFWEQWYWHPDTSVEYFEV